MRNRSRRILQDVGGILDPVLKRRVDVQMLQTMIRPSITDGRDRRIPSCRFSRTVPRLERGASRSGPGRGYT